MPVPSKSLLRRIAANREKAVSDMRGRLGEMTPGPGQFVTSTTLIPADLMTRAELDLAQEMVTAKITGGFIAAYRRAAELPE